LPRGPSEKGWRIQRLPARSSAIPIRFQAAWSSLSPDATSSDNASDSTSATVLTGWMWISARTDSGTSSRSGSFRRGTMTSVRPARWAASSFCLTPPMGRTRQSYPVRLGLDVTEQRRLAGARRRRNYDDSACDCAIERIQKSAAIGFRRVALVPQSEPSSAATTTLSAVDLSCTASLVLARAYSARTAGHVR
jgi:hypothetical protein